MKLIELSDKQTVRREEAAQILRELADRLARQNEVEFVRRGMRVSAKVATEVEIEVELEIDSKGNSLEVEINW